MELASTQGGDELRPYASGFKTTCVTGFSSKLHTTLKMNLQRKIVLIGILFVVFIFLLFFLYKGVTPPLNEDEFINIYIQLSIANEKYQNDPRKLNEEKKQISKHFKVTQKDIEKFIKRYQKNPEKWAGVWEKVNKKLEELNQSK